METKRILFSALFCLAATTGLAKKLEVGMQAPYFKLQDENGVWRTSGEFKGKKLVLYFYPKDNAKHCTSQACSLRDDFSMFTDNNIAIVGINYEKPEVHAAFKREHTLPFPLLSDTTGEVASLYNSDKGFWGNFYANRNTFLIDENGTIIAVLKDVDVASHARQIIEIFGLKTGFHGQIKVKI